MPLTFAWLIVEQTAVKKQSDMEVIFSYITRPKGYITSPTDSCFYLVDNDFRTFKATSERTTSETRMIYIRSVLSKKISLSGVSNSRLRCLITSNSSTDIKKLRTKAAHLWAHKANLFLLTISSPFTLDDKRYYYVERVFKDDKSASANIYVLKGGMVQNVFPVWTN